MRNLAMSLGLLLSWRICVGDTIVLKDGRQLQGNVIARSRNKIAIKTDAGKLVMVKTDEVVTVELGDKGKADRARPRDGRGATTIPRKQKNLLPNGDFAKRAPEQPERPESWHTFAGGGEFEVATDKAGGRGGSPCLRVEGTAQDEQGRAGAFCTTLIPEGTHVLRVSAWTRGEKGRRAILFQFFDATNKREIVGRHTIPISGSDAEPRRIEEDLLVPRDLWGRGVGVRLMLYLFGSGCCWWDNVSLKPLAGSDLKVRDQVTSPLLVQPHPGHGSDAEQNPPDLRWRPEALADTYELQLCQRPDFTGSTLLTADPIKYHCLNLAEPLARGTWYWRYRLDIGDGDKSEFGKTRKFRIRAGLPVFTLPAMAQVRRQLGHRHPRIFVTPDGMPEFRARRIGAMGAWWAEFSHRLEAHLEEEPAAEPIDCDLTKLPRRYDSRYFSLDRKLRLAAGQVTAGLWDLAFGYLVSGEPKYASGARKYLLNVSRWDPKGATSRASNDNVSRPILVKSAMAYDWLYNTLTPTERETVVKAITERGRALFRKYTGRNCILSYPYDSHGQTSIGYLALVALAVAGDVSEADEWLDYTIKAHANSFPSWGGADGGWSQGVTYWEGSSYTAGVCAAALRSAAGIDLYRKPWYRQNGYFKMYCHPPWCTLSHFGDAHPEGPGVLARNSLAHYAAVYGDPYLQWSADRIAGPMDTSPYGYFLYSSDVTPKPPFDLAQARLFRDVGWAAMHSRLYAPDDVMLMAKSSWYGSCSHSHADQNSFVIYAYGEPLAIDSGYYPWWMSPHHKAWTLQTKAHNCILVDGQGQPIQDITAKGQCIGWLAGPGSAFWEGEAAPAYAGKLKRFRRYIAFLPPDLFIVHDDVESTWPATFQWTLHALERMAIDSANRSVLIRRHDARLLVKHVWPEQLSQSQHDDFGVPPEPRRGKTDKQWHYAAETVAKSDRAEFVTVMCAFQGDRTPDLSAATHASGNRRSLVVRAGDREVRFTLGPPSSTGSSPLQFDRSASMVEKTANGKVTRFMLANSVRTPASAPDLVSATQPVSLVAKRTPDGMRLSVAFESEATLRLGLDRAPRSVTLDGQALNSSEWRYQGDQLQLSVPDGDHAIELLHRLPITVASATKLSILVAGELVEVAGGAGRSVNDTRVAWASFAATPGAYRVSLRDADGADVWLDRQRLREGCVATLQAKNLVLIESALDGPLPDIAFAVR